MGVLTPLELVVLIDGVMKDETLLDVVGLIILDLLEALDHDDTGLSVPGTESLSLLLVDSPVQLEAADDPFEKSIASLSGFTSE